VVFDVHRVASGEPNAALIDLAADVANAVQPLLRPVESLTADIQGPESWRGHLSLASHELLDRADLRDEVEAFIHQLDIAHPSSFPAQLVAVFRLHHQSWSGPWWTTFRWEPSARSGSATRNQASSRSRKPSGLCDTNVPEADRPMVRVCNWRRPRQLHSRNV